MFYIQPEVSFLPKGVTHKFKPWFGMGPIDITLNYYEVTTNALFKVDMDNLTPFIFAGPSLSFLSEAKSKYDSYENESRLFKKTDFSINFGGGVELPISKSIDLFIMARYSLGLTNILKNDTESEYNTRGTAIAVGLKFSI
jgi:opacity protein-like surface antigen